MVLSRSGILPEMKATPDLIHIGSLKSWMAPECVSINRVPMRATIYPFPSAQTARSVDRGKTPWFQLLNGQWQFKAVDRPENVALAMWRWTATARTGIAWKSPATGRSKGNLQSKIEDEDDNLA